MMGRFTAKKAQSLIKEGSPGRYSDGEPPLVSRKPVAENFVYRRVIHIHLDATVADSHVYFF